MPFLYTASQANNYTHSNSLFNERGLSDLAPQRPNDLLLIGRPHQYELAYGSYIHALPAFLKATVNQTKVSALDPGQSFTLPPSSYLPIAPPPLLLKPTRTLRDEGARAELLAKVGAGSEITTYQERAHVSIESPIYPDLAPSLSLFESDNRTTTNTANLLGYRTYLQTVKILTAFLATHSYAAFQSPESSRLSSTMAARCSLVDDSAALNSATIDYTAELIARGLPPVTTSESRRTLVGNIPEEFDGIWNLQSAVVVANPSPMSPEINFGPPGGVPNLPGYILPYFNDLIVPDQNFLPSIMRRFFLRNFGSTTEEIDQKFKAWKSGHTNIFRTNSGKILSHIFLCVQAALEGQARLYVIQSGRRYLGCAVLGYNFHLSINGIVRIPETPVTLRSLLTDMDPHMQAIATITETLRTLDLREGGMRDLTQGELTSGKAVWRAINEREKAVDEDLKTLKDAVDRLTFETRYWTMSKSDILKWIRLLASPIETVAEEVDGLPMYLCSELMYNTSREHQVLAAFGPMSPSFLNLSGGRFKFPASSTDTDHASIPDEANGGKRPLERLLVTGKRVPVAVSDWKKMSRSREVSQNQAQRSAGYKNVAFTQGARDEIWEALKTIPPFVPENKKRGREEGGDDDDEDKEEGSSKKKARTKESTAADLFADL